MWWGNSPDKDPKASAKETPAADPSKKANAKDAIPFDPNKLPNREKLPPALQKIVEKADKEENFFDELVEGYVPQSTDSNVRFAAYASRVRTILVSAHRYVAYTSDIGESFRPIAHPWLVRGAYGVSWAYIAGDVSYEGYKAYRHNKTKLGILPAAAESADSKARSVPPLEDWKTVVAQRAIFQSVASMGLPAFTIHSVVRYSGRALKDVKNKTIRTWGPIGLGLAVVPFLPTLFDEPVENAVEWAFHKGFQTFGGKAYVGESPSTGREEALNTRPPKEKEL
ncbi:Mitochondrial fission process protein 1 [Cytospora mali]|uniref:Mitochondrial fission process protein 1 n=1 Tax=Cytospora mali TaxID=578113 RepID=A0A194VV84_CYTMA|nr:Mitochondrial fission process protein 1 [Valsa mali]